MRSDAGFTLLEVLVSTAVFAFVAAALVGVYSLGIRSASRYGSHTSTLDQGELALSRLENDAIASCGATRSTAYPASASALALIEPTYDANGVLVASSDVVVYHFVGSQLERDVVPGPGGSRSAVTGQIVLAASTGSPAFTYLAGIGASLTRVSRVSDAEVVRVQLQASSSLVTDAKLQWFHGEFRMRNKR